jgi:hypothetical protein
MLKFAFKDVSTKNSEPTYWTILFVMQKNYFIYKVAGKTPDRNVCCLDKNKGGMAMVNIENFIRNK